MLLKKPEPKTQQGCKNIKCPYSNIRRTYIHTHTKNESKGVGQRSGGIEEKVKLDTSDEYEKCGNNSAKLLLSSSSKCSKTETHQ